jgi:hypothetical protein
MGGGAVATTEPRADARGRVTDDRRRRGLRVAVWAALIAAVWGLAFGGAWRRPVVRSDEAWMLWVAVRANSGVALYRGTYFVTTPLALWVLQGAVQVFGAHVWVERALACACLTGSIVLVWLIGGRLGLATWTRVLVCGGLFLYGAPVAHFASLYSMLAVALSLAALLALLSALDELDEGRRPSGRLALVGAWCGAAFASKPNIGLAALAATVLVVAVAGRRVEPRRWRPLVGATTLGFGIVTVVTLVPFLVNGTLGALIGDVFTGKGSAYLSVETRGVFPGFANAFDLVTGSSSSFGQQIGRTILLVPLVALILVVIAAWRTRHHMPCALLAVLLFSGVGVIAAAPDFGPQHITEAVPLLLGLPVLALSATRTPSLGSRPYRRVLVLTAALVLVVGAVAVASWAHRPTTIGTDHITTENVPDFAGPMTSAVNLAHVHSDLNELRHDTHGPVFLAFLSASYYYLAGHLSDPTAFDYPARSDLGPGGEGGLIHTLRRDHVTWACLGRYLATRPPPSSITTRRVNAYVHHTYRFVEHLNICDLYHLASKRFLTPLSPKVSEANPPRTRT